MSNVLHAVDGNAEFALPDEAATVVLGEALAGALSPGLVIHLEGDLGAGKTTLVRALLRHLGHAGPVKSPTYSLVECYVISSLYLYHFDFYRFESPEEFIDAGLGDYFHGDAVCLVEWPQKAGECAPAADLRLSFSFLGEGRRVVATPLSAAGALCLRQLTSFLSN